MRERLEWTRWEHGKKTDWVIKEISVHMGSEKLIIDFLELYFCVRNVVENNAYRFARVSGPLWTHALQVRFRRGAEFLYIDENIEHRNSERLNIGAFGIVQCNLDMLIPIPPYET
jgi:hypothetical protein